MHTGKKPLVIVKRDEILSKFSLLFGELLELCEWQTGKTRVLIKWTLGTPNGSSPSATRSAYILFILILWSLAVNPWLLVRICFLKIELCYQKRSR